MRGIGYRRHHRERVIHRALDLVRNVWGYRDGKLDEWARKNAHHLPKCSCYMCRGVEPIGQKRERFNQND
jgi:hypothetical protein